MEIIKYTFPHFQPLKPCLTGVYNTLQINPPTIGKDLNPTLKARHTGHRSQIWQGRLCLLFSEVSRTGQPCVSRD